MRRAVLIALALVMAAPASAWAHSSFLGSSPEPGTRLGSSPRAVSLTFTEALNRKLSTATLVALGDGRHVRATAHVFGRRLVLRPARPLPRGPYQVRWHSVSTDDGHALEGSFSFGVRAAAVGGEHAVEQSPFARDGWLRVIGRAAMYGTLLVFSGALLFDGLMRRRGRAWLVPEELGAAAPTLDRGGVERRYRRVVLDVGFLAVGASAFSAVADAIDAAGGLSPHGLRDFLLSAGAGVTRLYVVAFVLLAVALTAMRFRAAAVAALGALGAVALSGHANASSPQGLAVVNDWVHLSATALWLGGIALIVVVWGPVVRGATRLERLAVARHVLPRFGRMALPAFAVVVGTGLVSAVIELGRVQALWDTDYGRVLIVKVGFVALIAAASCVHALRLRPRILAANPHPDARAERRHWRLLRAEPLLGVGVVAAVALLVAFPLPPRQLGDADEAEASSAPAAACNPCPLPRPTRGELAIAEQGGSDLVAAWVRRERGALVGTVRVYALNNRPAGDPFSVRGASRRSCGHGCARFRVSPAPAVLDVAVRQKGRTYLARLPVRWRAGQERQARTLLARAQKTMRALRSVREAERVSSVPGSYAITDYRLKAPNRMSYRTNGKVQSIVVGATQWTRGQPGIPWQKGEFGGGLPFRTRSWFTWTTYASYAYLLGERTQGRRRLATVALMDPGTPAWWRLTIDRRTNRVLQDRLVTSGHFMTQRFTAFNAPLQIEPPDGSRRGG